ncbi:unnamed protein product, partial [Adineta steineri]
MKLASPFTGRPVATMQITIPQIGLAVVDNNLMAVGGFD